MSTEAPEAADTATKIGKARWPTFVSDTNTSGVAGRTLGHLPFGDVWYETGTIEKFKFTSYERDTESNLDYATFRFSSSRLGRFMSADPLAGSAASPQSLNRYSYVSNDPVNLGGPLGLGADGFFNCLLDGFLAPCGLGSAAVAAGAAGELPAGLSTVGFINGYAYFLTLVDNGIGGSGFSINYWGIPPSTAAFELGLPTSLSSSLVVSTTGRLNPANNGKPTCLPTSSLNWSQKAQLLAAQFYANLTGWTFGFGAAWTQVPESGRRAAVGTLAWADRPRP